MAASVTEDAATRLDRGILDLRIAFTDERLRGERRRDVQAEYEHVHPCPRGRARVGLRRAATTIHKGASGRGSKGDAHNGKCEGQDIRQARVVPERNVEDDADHESGNRSQDAPKHCHSPASLTDRPARLQSSAPSVTG